MSKTRRLNELTNDVRRLCILQKNDVRTAYETIRNDERFEGWITLSKLQKIFMQLQKGRQPTIDLHSYIFNFLNEIKPQSFQLNKTTLLCDHEIQSCLGLSHGFSMDGRFVLYNTLSNISYSNYGFLLYDTFNNKSRYIMARKRQNSTFNGFVFLNDTLGLLFERTENVAFSSLMKLDWNGKKMRTVQISDILPSNSSNVMINALNPTQIAFLGDILSRRVRVQLCEIKNDEIVQLRVITIGSLSYPRAVFDGKLYSFGCSNHYGEEIPNIYVSNLDQDARPSIFALEWPSNEFSIVKPFIYCWVRDHFYVVVRFEESGKLGIARTNCKNLDWTLIKFITAERIVKMQFATETNILLVQTVSAASTSRFKDVHQVQHTFYRIPIKKPDSLSSLAWSTLVQSKNKLPNVDPYEQARRYLPFTSEIRYPFDK